MTAAVVFDLDGTLLDSDAALRDAFVALGVPAEEVTFGHVVDDECRRLGIALTDYLAAYDLTASRPFRGVPELLAGLGGWSVCSNKHPDLAGPELERLGWHPRVACFSDRFGGPKTLHPVLEELELDGGDILFVGDTDHDRRCAQDVGASFVLAGWNPRTAAIATDVVAQHPRDVLGLLT